LITTEQRTGIYASAETADQTLTDTYVRAGFTGAFRLGHRPALVVVDFCLGFTDPSCPLGSEMDQTVKHARALLDEARRRKVLTVFTTISYDPGSLATTTWLRKVPSLGELVSGSRWVQIDTRLGRLEREPLITKGGASAFFGTGLNPLLVASRIDTVLVLGATTSGCVRATVTDSVQHGFDTFVVTDCVADRSVGPHEANLFDMTAKYADGIRSEEVMAYLQQLPKSDTS
jgi:maleamate amidohydrolase